ncbi:hypothetical protein SAMN04515656_11222 [Eubacterium aggregans]|uniref:Replication terminator protein n=1 Tax=Eubacterium aggregans TaxID=81409 RepID=A0A1H4BP76_9FIRM|nr:hypothetical protein [Eubacterium aggregans]SEA49916.1 hypothetical protein SAMN04515656_11222 [Eubacterium aggregans]
MNLYEIGQERDMNGLGKMVEDAMNSIQQNILDQRTPGNAKRKIKIEITVEPGESRNLANIEYTVKTELAPLEGKSTGADVRNGMRPMASPEYYTDGQVGLHDVLDD